MSESVCTINKSGNKYWENSKGEFHRTDGPTVECANGYKAWYFNDQRHRTDGPAIEDANGDKEWWVNGQLHRIDGPAIEYVDGTEEYWYKGEQIIEKIFYSDEFQVRMVMQS
jgi:hypothetical protein